MTATIIEEIQETPVVRPEPPRTDMVRFNERMEVMKMVAAAHQQGKPLPPIPGFESQPSQRANEVICRKAFDAETLELLMEVINERYRVDDEEDAERIEQATEEAIRSSVFGILAHYKPFA